MFLPFNEKGKRKQPPSDSSRDKVAIGIVQKCIKLQLRWAYFMRRKTEFLSHRQIKYLLLLFCFVSVGGSLYLAVKGFHGNDKRSLFVTPIDVPVHSTKTGEEAIMPFLTITKNEVERIERFKRYIDSLSQTESGRKIKTQFLLSRPGLMDSIEALQKLYQLQSSKK